MAAQGHGWRAAIAVTAALLFGGCSLSDSITSGSIDYDRALEDVGNAMVVSNVLRARDGAPLYFTDLSQIRGSLQLQLQGQASAPVGPQYVSSTRTRAGLTSTITVNSSPSFDVVPLNTKEFTEGITTPVELRTLQYYSDRVGESDRTGRSLFSMILLRLFIEKVDLITGRSDHRVICEFYNHPDGELRISDSGYAARPLCDRSALATFHLDSRHLAISRSGTVNFNDIVPALARRLVVVGYHEPFGPPVQISGRDFLHEASQLAAHGLEPHPVPNHPGLFQLDRTTPRTVLCLEPDSDAPHPMWYVLQQARPGEPVSWISARSAQEICAPGGAAAAGISAKEATQIVIYLRSVESVIAYLGQMLNVPDKDRALPFFIRDTDTGHSRFRVFYRDRYYYVDDNQGRSDETLQVLSIVNLTLNLYKNANEIPTTRAVQSVP